MAKPQEAPQRAAQYLRVSTDRQDLSIGLQGDAIASYATQRGVQVIATYEDEARSGLRIKNRPAMQRLMADVTDPRCPFACILVYDISRWGRFQDTDESAYWDHHCRRHGVEVVYVAEGFANEASPFAALVKNLKRAMAAEYSRELGHKVRAGMLKHASMGHKQSGVPSLGLLRQVVSPDGTPKMVLGHHERKAIQSDRVRLIPGPPEEVALVRLIFEQYAGTDIPIAALARELTAEGYRTRIGRPITEGLLQSVLRQEAFIGNYVWGRRRVLPNGSRVKVRPSEQPRVDGLITPIIERPLWDKVQAKLRARAWIVRSRETMLRDLGEALTRNPSLRCADLRASGCASLGAYNKAFGSFTVAKRLACPSSLLSADEAKGSRFRRTHRIGRAFQADLAGVLRQAGASVSYGPKECSLQVNGKRIQIQVAWSHSGEVPRRWFVARVAQRQWDSLVVLRMNEDETARDFFVVPASHRPMFPVMLRETNAPCIEAMRVRDVQGLVDYLLKPAALGLPLKGAQGNPKLLAVSTKTSPK